MKTKIKLADIDIKQLSTDAINLLTKITLRIRKLGGKSLSFSDPQLLQKISRAYKRLNDPETTMLYQRYKQALKMSVNGIA